MLRQTQAFRRFATKATKQTKTEAVKLRGTHLKSKMGDMPTMIWLPEILEPAANFVPFFSREDNRIRELRNVWCLDYRNQGDSDHHHSYDMDDIAADIIRFMDE